MGIKLSEITSGVRPVAVTRAGVTINVVYRLAARTIEGADGERQEGESPYALARAIQRLVVSWDLTDDLDAPIPLEATVLEQQVPVPWLRAILDDVYEDDGVGEAESSSDAS